MLATVVIIILNPLEADLFLSLWSCCTGRNFTKVPKLLESLPTRWCFLWTWLPLSQRLGFRSDYTQCLFYFLLHMPRWWHFLSRILITSLLVSISSLRVKYQPSLQADLSARQAKDVSGGLHSIQQGGLLADIRKLRSPWPRNSPLCQRRHTSWW